MIVPVYSFLAAANASSNTMELVYIWTKATPEAKIIIIFLVIFSIVAWSTMISKALQMRRAKRLNAYFNSEFRNQKNVLGMYDRRLQVDGCPLFVVYHAGSVELDARLKHGVAGEGRKQHLSIKAV